MTSLNGIGLLRRVGDATAGPAPGIARLMVVEIQPCRRWARHVPIYGIGAVALVVLTAGAAFRGYATNHAALRGAAVTRGNPADSVADGQRIFRFDTFGDEQFWTDTLHMNQVVESRMWTPRRRSRSGSKSTPMFCVREGCRLPRSLLY